MPMTDNPANMRQQARGIASNKSARAAWSELKSWASGKGPIAMKSAADEFIAIHGRSPEAAILLPEVLHSASWGMSPMERHGMLAGHRPSPMLGRPSPTQFNPREPKEMLPLSILFRPKQKDDAPRLGAMIPLDSQHDPVYLKDAQFRMRGSADLTLPKPFPGPQQKSFDPAKSPDSFHMGAQASSGGELLRNLVHNMRTHGRDDFTRSHSMPMRDAPLAKTLASKPIPAQAPKPKAAKPKTAKPKAAKARKIKSKSKKRVVRKAKPARKKARVPSREPAKRALAKTAKSSKKRVIRAPIRKTARKSPATKARSRPRLHARKSRR